MTRLRILQNDDFDKFYKIPNVTEKERNDIFKLDIIDNNYLNTLNRVLTVNLRFF